MNEDRRSDRRRRLLVTGCGRSGTKFTAVLLQRLGLDVRHEQMGRDGIAAWALAVSSPITPPWGPAAAHYRFDEVYHQVRHPLAVIASAATFKNESWEYIYAHTSTSAADAMVIRGAKYWLEWNLNAERMATWRYRVEDLDDVFDQFCARIGVTADRDALARTPIDCNTRRYGRLFHYYDEASRRLRIRRAGVVAAVLARPSLGPPELAWGDLRTLDADLAERVRAKAAEYGYPE